MYQMYHHRMFLFSIVAATAESVCLIPNPLMKALIRVMMNTITWMMIKMMMMMTMTKAITRMMLFKIFALAWLSSSLMLIMAIRKNRSPTTS